MGESTMIELLGWIVGWIIVWFLFGDPVGTLTEFLDSRNERKVRLLEAQRKLEEAKK